MLGLIWAQAEGGVIGNEGSIPWHLPEDLAHFKATTMGSTVLMGRLTWESIPDRFRPLPGRRNLVLTRQTDWEAVGAERVASIDEAIALTDTDLWVIGGAQVYAASLPLAERVVVTFVDGVYTGDAFAPVLGPGWRPVLADTGWLTSSTGLRYKLAAYEKAAAIPSTP
jgi:dihydrofolate reductase